VVSVRISGASGCPQIGQNITGEVPSVRTGILPAWNGLPEIMGVILSWMTVITGSATGVLCPHAHFARQSNIALFSKRLRLSIQVSSQRRRSSVRSVTLVLSMITVGGYRIEKTRQIDRHSIGRGRLAASIAVSIYYNWVTRLCWCQYCVRRMLDSIPKKHTSQGHRKCTWWLSTTC
jgi:hypothetical protein